MSLFVALTWLLPAVFLALCLFGPAQSLQTSGVVGTWVREIALTFRDAETQWMVYACLVVYLVTFLVLQRRRAERFGAHGVTRPTLALSYPVLWLIAGLVIATLAYAFSYSAASKSTDALMLLGGVVLGKAASVWARWSSAGRDTPCAPNGGQRTARPTRTGAVVVILTLLLLLACWWQPEEMQRFQYRGQARWNGPWDNPNVFGLLMGVGMVLAVGRLVSVVSNAERGVRSGERAIQKAESRNWRAEIWRWIRVVLFATAAVVCGIGLVKSYSRGAWVATACGVTYLVIHSFWNFSFQFSAFSIWLRRNWLPLSVVLSSVVLLAFWSCRHTDHTLVRRAFSVGNINDFSWRNRVSAYEGILQMMATKPWLGFGWNQAERVYDQLYRPPEVAEGAAIQMNDYFMLGATLGIPALVCFVAYIWLSFSRGVRAESREPTEARHLTQNPHPQPLSHLMGEGGVGLSLIEAEREREPSALKSQALVFLLASVCRAGALVLLVGFWFDGGLFKLATATVFWVLLELGTAQENEARVES